MYRRITFEAAALRAASAGLFSSVISFLVSVCPQNSPIVTAETRWNLAVFLLGTAFFVCTWSWHLLETLSSRVIEKIPSPWSSWIIAWTVLTGVCGVGAGTFAGSLPRGDSIPADLFVTFVFVFFGAVSFQGAKDDYRRFCYHDSTYLK